MGRKHKPGDTGLTPAISDAGIANLEREVLAAEAPEYEPTPDEPADFVPPPPDGPHAYKRVDGGWKCSQCANHEVDPRELGAKTCPGKR